jgi:hypothetical protein
MNAGIDYARPFAGARWIDVLPRSAACPYLPPQVLLHAGPPFAGQPPAPVLHAAIQALLYDGMAKDAQAATDMLTRGGVQLEPAQHHGVVTPLAQVVSATMPLMAVEQGGAVSYAPIIEGPPPALRFGSPSPACREALRDMHAWVRAALVPLLRRQAPAIDAIISAATRGGDECHARTAAANAALAGQFGGLEPADAQRLRNQPAFVLPLLMAAAAAALRSHNGPVAGIGGNGLEFGVHWRTSVSGPPAWIQCAADAPIGPRFAGHETRSPLAAIGDSAVIDFCGLGGQALAAAPLLTDEWQKVLPADAIGRRAVLIDPASGLVDAQRVRNSGCSPLINLAILDRAGAYGLIGRGIYLPPVALFSPPATGQPCGNAAP